MFDDAQLVKYFPAMLKALRARIEALPDSLPVALPDGPLARYFGDFEIDEEEDEQHKRITRGEHGMDLICPFLEFYSQQDGIKGTDGVGMLARRIRDLNSILDTLKHTMSDSRSSMAALTVAATVVTKELLNAGFGEGVDFLEGVSIH
ncbi:hypothetical protein R3P38DRAFT_3370332 [Favolaschia claudopus]|uniref:Uncharacterized protein n=1 Tax=Favolaschia claudopus TaxID=2862362 RepID=A0AAW0A1H7_9AGAR